MKLRVIWLLILAVILAGCSNLKYQDQPIFYSYVVGNVDQTKPIKEYNSKAYITPASCQKTITALLAYKNLGSNYRYQTNLYVTKDHDQIKDVIISFVGDPTLTSGDLAELIKPLQNVKIKGRIIIDASKYQVPALSNNLMKYDIGRNYSQPVSAMIIDQNLINLSIKTEEIGKSAIIKNDLGYRIDASNLIVSDANSKNKIDIEVEGDNISAYGNIAYSKELFLTKISPALIDDYILRKLKLIFSQINLSAKIIITHNQSKLPKDLEVMNHHQSQELSKFLPPALKKSDNLVFDSLYLNIIDANKTSEIKDWPDGDKIYKSLIKNYFDLDLDGALIVDGSGLSRLNHIQTYSLFEILRKGYSQKEFVTSLPIPGETNSTLEKRTNLPKNLHAKTGSLYGISCLCGYQINDNETKVFIIINNNFSPSVSAVTGLQDRFINDNL